MKGEEERCLASGMDAYLVKPVSIERLRATLERWLPVQAESSDRNVLGAWQGASAIFVQFRLLPHLAGGRLLNNENNCLLGECQIQLEKADLSPANLAIHAALEFPYWATGMIKQVQRSSKSPAKIRIGK